MNKHQFLRNKNDIDRWLRDYEVENYIINPDMSVDVEGNLILYHCHLKSIEVDFNKVSGDFTCEGNELTSLLGAPKYVGNHFVCADNKLTNLKGSPALVRGNFFCSKNNLTTLLGAPQRVEKSVMCYDNQLTSLEFFPNGGELGFYHVNCGNNELRSLRFCPEHMRGYFDCRNNKIENLEFCPKSVGHYFFCSDNPLLGHLQEVNDFKTIHEAHFQYAIIKQEKERLNLEIKSNDFESPKPFKI